MAMLSTMQNSVCVVFTDCPNVRSGSAVRGVLTSGTFDGFNKEIESYCR